MAHIHIEAIEVAAQANAEKKKNEQARQAERVVSEELDALIEGAQPNTRAPGASILGQGNSPLLLTYASHFEGLVRDRKMYRDYLIGAVREVGLPCPIFIDTLTLMYSSGFLQYGNFFDLDNMGDQIHSFSLGELSHARLFR